MIGWRCPSCESLNDEDHHWCPTCGPDVRPEYEIHRSAVATTPCPACLRPIDPGQVYHQATGKHMRCVRTSPPRAMRR